MNPSSASFPSRLSKRVFVALVIVALVLGIVSVVMVGLWMGHYTEQGFAWTARGKTNLHPFIFTVGMVVIYGNATLSYRILGRLSVPRHWIKIIHAVMMVIVIVAAAFGLYLDFSIFADFGTMHAVMGIATIILVVLQFLFAALIFALPYAPGWLRASYMWPHSFFGMLALVAATATCLTGTELGQKSLASNKGLSLSFGMILATFTAVVTCIVCNESFRVVKKTENKADRNRSDYGSMAETDLIY